MSDKVKMMKLSDYHMGETLGTGSFGRVKIAKNKKTNKITSFRTKKFIGLVKTSIKQINM